ncbi:hypothetical protein BKA67DRAFT_567019 [Truncatella angustata]|uniref:2EXR domain-containing protein n=1 Tax=Truncatella angustata TaxID=152316 RepID=A0A9P8UHT1_9PEZI|nr:uncharacterized protein BKA67DRAFT_567019 [Truncatella angustata]KAH6652613.1 hypothetical protein BKA67DRAFT_567019 [Truncatella angustata]
MSLNQSSLHLMKLPIEPRCAIWELSSPSGPIRLDLREEYNITDRDAIAIFRLPAKQCNHVSKQQRHRYTIMMVNRESREEAKKVFDIVDLNPIPLFLREQERNILHSDRQKITGRRLAIGQKRDLIHLNLAHTPNLENLQGKLSHNIRWDRVTNLAIDGDNDWLRDDNYRPLPHGQQRSFARRCLAIWREQFPCLEKVYIANTTIPTQLSLEYRDLDWRSFVDSLPRNEHGFTRNPAKVMKRWDLFLRSCSTSHVEDLVDHHCVYGPWWRHDLCGATRTVKALRSAVKETKSRVNVEMVVDMNLL